MKLQITPGRMTTQEVIRTVFCMVLLVLLVCVACYVIAKINTQDDPVARTQRPVSVSTRWDRR